MILRCAKLIVSWELCVLDLRLGNTDSQSRLGRACQVYFHAVVQDANGVSAESEEKIFHFGFLYVQQRSGYIDFGLFLEF